MRYTGVTRCQPRGPALSGGALLGLWLVCAPADARAEPKIAYVDLQRAVDESHEGKQAKARLQAEYDKRQRELDAQKDELRRLLERDPQKPELLERELSLEKRGQKLERELDEQQATESKKVLTHLKAAIAQLAAARKLDWVLDSSTVLAAPPGTDLTDDLLRELGTRSPPPSSRDSSGSTPKRGKSER